MRIDDDATVWSDAVEEISERFITSPLVIVMHGRGSNEGDLPRLFPFLPEGVVYASLRAPIDANPWGLDGWTWFRPESVAGGVTPPGPSEAAARSAARAVLDWIDRVEAAFGAPPAIAGLGFSQGGSMAMQLMRESPGRFAAAVNLSGVSALGDAPGDAELARRRPPLFWGRDADDPIVPASGISRTVEFAPAHFALTERLYPGNAHSISPEELVHVSAFLREHLPLDPAQQVPASTY